MDNLFSAWKEFKRGKTKRKDVLEFEFNLEDNIFQIYQELKSKTYRHSYYTPFFITDPKLRRIHKACVRDRIIHQAIFRVLSPIFEKSFIFDSFSCRLNKGTHKAVNRLKSFCNKASKNNYLNIHYLKCDIKKFFNSIDQEILLNLIKRKIKDSSAIGLIENIVKSFQTSENKGLPLGNVTSQLFANIYLNELDQFIKRKLKIKYYIRYCDDFIVLDRNQEKLRTELFLISDFLRNNMRLEIHENKIFINKYRQGIDFLGYVVFPHHRILRNRTKKRMFKKLLTKQLKLNRGLVSEDSFFQSLQSYLGILKHCDGYKIRQKIRAGFQKFVQK